MNRVTYADTIRGAPYLSRAPSEKLTMSAALKRYMEEVSVTKKATTQRSERFFAAADAHSNPMLGWIVRLAVETGMRSSEITGLRHSQVDLNRRVVTLKDTKNGSACLVPLTRVAVCTSRDP
ncbi:tyrosine-type recombinase/integrase [Burkholderia pseudomultivorans]|nr:tyrosine-type recombinase/integrase [Burkholderia multivorans]MCL4653027.1 tyrosine-type recombinase/integrase [Burkholderia multivorans]MCO1427534.1 tyrosine-type recombinase/integrase [Burkholderia multivorans]UQN82824.1 tyrosine-type recombinase/integrase [Burkholderia multivorans]UQO66266.1 tyrosine-type recombinase/integrase [Burkholderia multivorans]UQP13898.1 tyrosine-type recombinase/integrase [Burkholderia multivorans]